VLLSEEYDWTIEMPSEAKLIHDIGIGILAREVAQQNIC